MPTVIKEGIVTPHDTKAIDVISRRYVHLLEPMTMQTSRRKAQNKEEIRIQ